MLGDSTTRCWGWNAYGQLGDGTAGYSPAPVTVVGSGGGAATNCARSVANVNYPDGSIVSLGQVFEKRWRLRNCGTTSWSGYQAARISGIYGPGSFPVFGAPGATVEVVATFTAPATPGTYRATYRLRGPNGLFGDPFWVENIHAPDIIATYMTGSPMNPYQSLHTYLTETAGYKEYPPDFTRTPLERCQQARSERQTDITLFVFAYDWRQNNDVNIANLSQFITCIKELTGAEKVDILAHSMGGLIARRYIAQFPNPLVATLVSIGSPWLGAPKTIYTLETGHIFDDIPLWKQWLALRGIAQASPAVAQLLPSEH